METKVKVDMTTQYDFTSRQRMLLLVGIAIGVLCLGITYVNDDATHTRFWTNFLHNSVFFTGISLMAGFFIAVCITAWAGWHAAFKRVWESMSMFLLVGLVLMGILAISTLLDWNHLYHWAGDITGDEILEGKSGFLNKGFYVGGTFLVIILWFFLSFKIRSLSIAEDTKGDIDFTHHRKQRVYAAIFLGIAGFSSAAMIWQWIMSLDSHWYSTMFAWYTGASWFVSMMCLTMLSLIYLKGKGYYDFVTKEHIHDLGKFIFAFSIFWTYLWFSQYMLIWYANVGEETIYFAERFKNYKVLFYANLAINFLLPFFILMRNDTKRKFGSVGFVAAVVFFGHWLDFFLMIKPGALITASHHGGHHGDHGHGDAHGHGAEAAHGHGHDVAADAAHHAGDHAAHASDFVSGFTLPGLLEIGTMVGFLCLFLYVFYTVLSRASLFPAKDPYIEESLHHHT